MANAQYETYIKAGLSTSQSTFKSWSSQDSSHHMVLTRQVLELNVCIVSSFCIDELVINVVKYMYLNEKYNIGFQNILK